SRMQGLGSGDGRKRTGSVRAFCLSRNQRARLSSDQSGVAEITVAEFESRFPNERLFIERLRQNNKIVESTPKTKIRLNDVLVIASRTETLIADASRFGVEVFDQALLDYP